MSRSETVPNLTIVARESVETPVNSFVGFINAHKKTFDGISAGLRELRSRRVKQLEGEVFTSLLEDAVRLGGKRVKPVDMGNLLAHAVFDRKESDLEEDSPVSRLRQAFGRVASDGASAGEIDTLMERASSISQQFQMETSTLIHLAEKNKKKIIGNFATYLETDPRRIGDLAIFFSRAELSAFRESVDSALVFLARSITDQASDGEPITQAFARMGTKLIIERPNDLMEEFITSSEGRQLMEDFRKRGQLPDNDHGQVHLSRLVNASIDLGEWFRIKFSEFVQTKINSITQSLHAVLTHFTDTHRALPFAPATPDLSKIETMVPEWEEYIFEWEKQELKEQQKQTRSTTYHERDKSRKRKTLKKKTAVINRGKKAERARKRARKKR